MYEEDLAWADYALISSMVIQKDSARRVVAQCKEAGVKVVAGGQLFTTEYDQFGDVDHLVLNEAEATLPSFLADLERGFARHISTRLQNLLTSERLQYGRWLTLISTPL